MPYDHATATRLQAAVLRARPAEPIDDRKMFGCLMLLLGGSMALGVHEDRLVVRVAETDVAAALRRPHARPMDFTGRPMRGFLYVEAPGFAREADLDAWVALGLAAARAAPARPRTARRRPSAKKPARASLR